MAEKKKDIVQVYNSCVALAEAINKKIKNKETVTEADLSVLNSSFREVVDFLKCYLINCADVLYGSILMLVETEISQRTRAFVNLKFEHKSFYLEFNPLFISTYKFTELVTFVVAEINRMIFEHPSEFAKMNPGKNKDDHELLEKSSDAATSSLISSDIRLKGDGKVMRLPNTLYTPADAMSETGKHPNDKETIEYYYRFLKKFKKSDKKPSMGGGMGLPLQGDGQGDSDGGQSNSPASPMNSQGGNAHDWENQDSQSMENECKSVVSDAFDSLSEKQRGMVAGSVISQIKKLLAPPEISWKDVLRKFVGTIPYPYRKCRRKLNRRQPERADLSGRVPRRKVNIVICIDTSGSMSNSDLEYVINEIFHIVKANETKITIIECDMVVNRVYEAKKPSDVRPDCHGRGGTAFTPAIEYINKEGKFKDALMIYFTDGYGEYEIPKPRTYRNMWVVLKDEKCLSLKEPFGEVKALSMDKDYKKFKQSL